MLRMQWFVDQFAVKISQEPISILDVGSYDVNGSYRNLFPTQRYQYLGLDMNIGPNVDIVLSSPYNWSTVLTDSFDIVISGQAFEHIEFFWITMSEMVRVLKKDGLLCVIVPCGHKEHRYPVDCYRFFTDGLVALARFVSLEILHVHTNWSPLGSESSWCSETCADSMLIARKSYAGEAIHPNLQTYKCTVPIHADLRKTGNNHD